jgi:hypothetical protein
LSLTASKINKVQLALADVVSIIGTATIFKSTEWHHLQADAEY